MGIKLDDIVGNKNKNILEDKSKKAINRLVIVIICIVILIVLLAYKVISDENKRRLREDTEKLLNDATTLSQAVSQRYLQKIQDNVELLGERLYMDEYDNHSKKVKFGGQEIKFETGYYYLTKDDVRQLAPNLNNRDLDYVVNYNTGEVVNLSGVKYNGKKYYFEEDLRAINKLLNNEQAIIPSDYTIFVNTPEDLLQLKDRPDYYFKLCSTIDLKDYSDDKWPSIEFSGKFDGRNYEIKNLNIVRPSDEKVGFFSEIKSGATVKNLSLNAVNINGGKYTGGIAGVLNSGAQVQNSAVWSGSVSSTSDDVGGAFGISNGEVKQVIVRCHVNCSGKNAGGFAGEITGGKYAQIAAKANKTTERVDVVGAYNIGGFAGLINPMNDVDITECCSYVNIYAGSNERASLGAIDDDNTFNYNAGGFVGAILPDKRQKINIKIESVYARGKIERCDKNVGGFAGVISATGVGSSIVLESIYTAVDTNKDGLDGSASRGGYVGYLDTGRAGGSTTGVFWRKDNLINDDLLNSGIGKEKSNDLKMIFSPLTTEGLKNPANYSWKSETLKKWKFYETRYGKDDLPTLAWEGEE